MDPVTLLLAAGIAALAPSAPDPTALAATRYIDHDHPAIAAAAREATAGIEEPRAQAVALHDFVRDRVRFGWTGRFHDQRASEVLASGVGYCNTKSTLFVALLRARGIPARPRFVSLDARILHGLIDPGTPYVDHSVTEVWLDGRWIATDSYIVDRPAFAGAQARLRAEGRTLGYGVHRNGTTDWDGRRNAFAQFADPALAGPDPGAHPDIGALVDSGRALNRLGTVARWLFPAFARQANRRIEALRTSSAGSAPAS